MSEIRTGDMTGEDIEKVLPSIVLAWIKDELKVSLDRIKSIGVDFHTHRDEGEEVRIRSQWQIWRPGDWTTISITLDDDSIQYRDFWTDALVNRK